MLAVETDLTRLAEAALALNLLSPAEALDRRELARLAGEVIAGWRGLLRAVEPPSVRRTKLSLAWHC